MWVRRVQTYITACGKMHTSKNCQCVTKRIGHQISIKILNFVPRLSYQKCERKLEVSDGMTPKESFMKCTGARESGFTGMFY